MSDEIVSQVTEYMMKHESALTVVVRRVHRWNDLDEAIDVWELFVPTIDAAKRRVLATFDDALLHQAFEAARTYLVGMAEAQRIQSQANEVAVAAESHLRREHDRLLRPRHFSADELLADTS